MLYKIRAQGKGARCAGHFTWFVFLIIFLFILAVPIPIAAETQTRLRDVAEITEAGTYLFSVGWDQGTLTAVLVAPDGTRSTPDKPQKGIAVASREKILIYKVSNASPGIWKMEFTDDDNGRVGIVVQRLIKPVQVENIVVSQIGDNNIKAQFTINGEKNAELVYDAYLSLDGTIGGSRHLGSGHAQAGQNVNAEFALGGIGSYDRYYLVVEAKCSKEGFTDFDVAVSDPFSYINPSAPEAVRSLKAISLPEGIEISWQPPLGTEPETYLISAFDDAEMPCHTVTVDAPSLSAVIPAGDTNTIQIQVAAIREGLTGQASRITVDRSVTLESLIHCQIPENGSLLSESTDIPYNVSAPTMISVMINDSRFAEEISGEGKLHINLAEGSNNIRIMAKIDETHAVGVIRSWSADTLPPMLRIYDDPDGQVTSDSVWKIAGNSDGASMIRVNSQTIASDPFSNFSIPVPLAIGSNTVEVIAIDKAGNQAVYTGRITRVHAIELKGLLKSPWFIVGMILLILAAALFLVAWRLKKFKALIALGLAGLMVLSSVSVGIGIFTQSRSGRSSKPVSDSEIIARAAVESNLGARAFDQAVKALRGDAGNPELILTAARAAVLAGDLPAADHYYQQILQLSDQDKDRLIDPETALAEVHDWNQAVLADDLDTAAVKKLAADVLDNARSDNKEIESVAPVVEELAQLTAAQISLSQFQSDSSATDSASWTSWENDLAGLVAGSFGQEASDLLAESYKTREDWQGLIEKLPDLADAGLISLTWLVLNHQIPKESAAGSYGQTWDLFMADLAERLENAANANPSEAVRLNTLAALICQGELNDPDRAERLLKLALQQFDPIIGTKDTVIDHFLMQMQVLLSDPEGSLLSGKTDLVQLANDLAVNQLSEPSDNVEPEPSVTPGEPTPEPAELPDGLNGERIRDDLQAFFNISAPEMTQAGRIRMMVTMAQASQGFPGGIPTTADFEFRSNIGFRHLFTVNSLTEILDVPRYTMLMIDSRPFIPGETLSLERQAALAYVRSKPADEKVVIVLGGLAEQGESSVCSDGLMEFFSNSEMECYQPTADREKLESFINAQYTGDVFSSPDLFHMISYPLSRMTAVEPGQVNGDWAATSLADLQPWFGQVLVFTNGDPNGGVTAGGDKTIDYIRGAAIAANTAIHIVGIDPVVPESDLQQLAEAGRGSYIDPSTDDLTAFYSFLRERESKVFIADCQFPENPQDAFVDIWARHIPTGVIAGFRRNPGFGADLVGTAHYSDVGLSENEFSDYTGEYDDPNEPSGDQDGYHPGTNPGGDPFADPRDHEQTEGTGEDLLDVDLDSIAVFGPDRHTIARGLGGLVLITLNGQGFSDLSPGDINITIVGVGRISTSFMDISSDTAIRFFLPATLPAGQYSLQVSIGELTFLFTDTLLIYDVNGVTSLTFGEWTLTAASMERAADDSGLWELSMVRINDLVRFSGNIRISSDWMDGSTDAMDIIPESDAYVSFDPESESAFVQSFFIEDGIDLQFGLWHPFSLTRSGEGASVSSRTLQDVAARPITLGLFDFPYDTGTLYPDRVEVPVLTLGLDLPLMEFLLMRISVADFSASAESMFTIRSDDLDLQLEASISSDIAGNKLFSALNLKGVELEIDTSISRVALGMEAELVPDKNIRVQAALKGVLLDELSVSIDVDIPLTTTPPSPIPVSLRELGGGAENIADAFSGDLMDLLGITIVGTAKFEAGNVVDMMPFVKNLISWIPADKVPPVLATDNTELRFRPWPFSLGFSTDVKLFDAFPIGHAELSLGYYAFTQSLLNISDDEAVGLHALLAVGPDIDFRVARIGYSAGPALDINNHGFFVQVTGSAWVGINLGIIGVTADMEGTFLIAVHDAEDCDWPQLSIVANAAPSVGIPALWDAGEVLDVRLLINENGIRLVGIPSPIDQALEWLDDQITGAASETWDAVTDGIDFVDEAAGEMWDAVTDTGEEIIDATTDIAVEIISDGTGLLMDTGSDVVDAVDNYTGGALSDLADTGQGIAGSIYTGISGFFS